MPCVSRRSATQWRLDVAPRLAAATLAMGLATSAQAVDASKCPIPVDALSQQLGQKLTVVFQGRALIGQGCEYQSADRSFKIAVDGGPNPAPSADAWRKMSNPPGTTWRAVPNDPDKAVIKATGPNGPAEPKLSYERKGWLVELTVVAPESSYAQWRDKLVKLPRIPQ
ncbi:MAG: hypothetical protein RI907_3123 [Pseudomonadota bacterium]